MGLWGEKNTINSSNYFSNKLCPCESLVWLYYPTHLNRVTHREMNAYMYTYRSKTLTMSHWLGHQPLSNSMHNKLCVAVAKADVKCASQKKIVYLNIFGWFDLMLPHLNACTQFEVGQSHITCTTHTHAHTSMRTESNDVMLMIMKYFI